jgi:hypothetical protein
MLERLLRHGLEVQGAVQAREPLSLEVAADATAEGNTIVPVDVSTQAVTITPPIGPKRGTWFAVVDSQSNAGTNAISVDFSGGNYHGSAGGTVSVSANRASGFFVYAGSAIGWMKVQ